SGRIAIDDVTPVVACGRYPSKAVVGEQVPICAAVWREGHDAVGATVVWRGPDGTARAWADRCPHRGMRLSFGYVRENTLTCIYHGWSFGSGPGAGAARCLGVPAHPGMTPPPGATVPVLPLAPLATR
ncbi:DUF3416 domain-containing protein, partial [Lacticaseibacillus rhamnosus]